MKRDIANIKRDLENKKNNDIIRKKNIIQQTFEGDPDLKEILGVKFKLPKNPYKDKDNPTEEELAERQRIEEYNEKIQHAQIVPFLKLNGIQKEVLNFVMFELDDVEPHFTNNRLKNQVLTILCLVHEDDMETEYDIIRTDLLSYIVKDLLNFSNVLGKQMKCTKDRSDIVDARYYCRELQFTIEEPNQMRTGVNNPYDKLP